jgi:hypothetical protein
LMNEVHVKERRHQSNRWRLNDQTRKRWHWFFFIKREKWEDSCHKRLTFPSPKKTRSHL